jgi:murein L,D-transpeptidase YafK
MREMARSTVLTILLSVAATSTAAEKADRVVVKKSEARLYLEHDGKVFASFNTAFGARPEGHKQQEGDERTPEGRYVLDSKKADSAYYKAIHISYPNAHDIASAKARGVKPGGLIMVHGQRDGWGWLASLAQLFNWTDGCIAVSNKDMETIWQAVDVGTPIEILP